MREITAEQHAELYEEADMMEIIDGVSNSTYFEVHSLVGENGSIQVMRTVENVTDLFNSTYLSETDPDAVEGTTKRYYIVNNLDEVFTILREMMVRNTLVDAAGIIREP